MTTKSHPPGNFGRPSAGPHSHPELEGEYVACVDAERRYVWVTDGVCRLLGCSRQELLGKKIEDVTPPESRPDVDTQFAEYVDKRVHRGEYVLLHKSGRRIPIQYEARIFKDGCMVARWTPLPRIAFAD